MKPNILFIASAFAASALAQTPALQIGAMYQCAPTQVLKVLSCNADACQAQLYTGGQPGQRVQPTRQQLATLLAPCHVQTPQEAQAIARASSQVSAQGDPNGFKVGDTVQINTAFGWGEGRIVSIAGNNYRVNFQGIEVTKTYPAELHRIGPLTPADRAAGLYDLHDRVQVNFEGKWIDSEVVTILGMEYQVKVPGNRVTWAKPENLRYVGAPLKPAAPAAGTPPKPGLVSCAGKFEGRYSNAGGFASVSIIFRSGKATLSDPSGGGEEVECWTGGGKIYLHKTGEPADQAMPIDINNDGTLDTPFGEIKKKGN